MSPTPHAAKEEKHSHKNHSSLFFHHKGNCIVSSAFCNHRENGSSSIKNNNEAAFMDGADRQDYGATSGLYAKI
jgi:hypothetical protein